MVPKNVYVYMAELYRNDREKPISRSKPLLLEPELLRWIKFRIEQRIPFSTKEKYYFKITRCNLVSEKFRKRIVKVSELENFSNFSFF